MTDQELQQLAREYAKSQDGVGKYDYLGNEYEAYLNGVEDAVKWLTARYCIVEKRKIRDYIDKAEYVAFDTIDLIEILDDLFGEETFNEK